MKSIITRLLAAICLVSILSCAPSVSVNEGATIGIWNEFPDSPNYIKKKTLVFRHKVSGFEENNFKQIMTRTVREQLMAKGHKVIEVQSRAALDQGRADFIVQILPLDIQKQEGTPGYGFYDRKILEFVLKQPARAYVCMNMVLHQKEKMKVRRTGRQENFSPLGLKELPDSPGQLTQEQKEQMSLTLEATIKKTCFTAMTVLGL